jgi:hypothetical protein
MQKDTGTGPFRPGSVGGTVSIEDFPNRRGQAFHGKRFHQGPADPQGFGPVTGLLETSLYPEDGTSGRYKVNRLDDQKYLYIRSRRNAG